MSHEKALRAAVADYRNNYSMYEGFAAYIEDLIRKFCVGGYVHKIESRAKDPDSLEKKCRKTNDDGSAKYPNSVAGITDLVGVRVIVFTRDGVDRACSEISDMFDVFDTEDVGDRVFQQGRFGYQSKHLLLRLGNDRNTLRENSDYKDLTCEIQVRTILQHAWAELEHDIQYKSVRDIPLDLNKRFSALAGLLEIADREFQQIQNSSAELKDKVRTELLTELTKEGLVNKAPEPHLNVTQTENVRDLVMAGRYTDAIALFDDNIKKAPQSYTHYIGRAKARYLAGDVRGALADLNEADAITSEQDRTARLRMLIAEGNVADVGVLYPEPNQISSLQSKFLDSLRDGDGVSAFECCEVLDSMNHNKAVTLFGKALSCVLEFDMQGARNFLSNLRLRPGTPMAVNIAALHATIRAVEGNFTEDSLNDLSALLEDSPQYRIDASHLRPFYSGLEKKKIAHMSDVEKIYNLLSSHPKQMFGI